MKSSLDFALIYCIISHEINQFYMKLGNENHTIRFSKFARPATKYYFLNGFILYMQMRQVINSASVRDLAVWCDVIYYALHTEKYYEFINNITHKVISL